MLQSSLFSQAIGTPGTIGGGLGVGDGGSNGVGVGLSAVGGVFGDGGPETGNTGSKGTEVTSGIGEGGTGGLTVANAEHLIVGLPVVPSGQIQTGL